MGRQTFALYFGNRGFFPESLIAGARQELKQAISDAGCDYLIMDENATRYGAVETPEEGRIYANFLKQNEGKYDGVIICLPNFGDENGAVAAVRDAGVPIYVQAYPDEIGKMDFENRRDAYCGKLSIEDMLGQYGIPYSVYPPHVAHPQSGAFAQNLQDFAAVCRIVKKLKRFSIGGIGARTTKFKTVRYDELALQKYGITFESYDLSELFARIRSMKDCRDAVREKKDWLNAYADFSRVPDDKFTVLAKISVAIDDMMDEYHLDTVSIRCWDEMHREFGVAPCVLLSELNDRGIAASCEMDVANTVTMYALSAASELPAGCVDWNNNYGGEPDKCILFHCGPIAQQLMTGRGQVGIHKMFAKGNGPDYGWGVDEGRIAPMDMTYASAATMNGKLYAYVDEGQITDDPIENTYFGCAGVAHIENLEEKLIYMGKNGYRHHTTFTKGKYLNAVKDAFQTYLNYELIVL